MLLMYILNKCSGNILVLFYLANMRGTGRSMPHLGGSAQLDHRRVVSWRVHRRRVGVASKAALPAIEPAMY